MIELAKLNGETIYLNIRLIETIQELEKSIVITLVSGKKITSKDMYETVYNRIVSYERKINEGKE